MSGCGLAAQRKAKVEAMIDLPNDLFQLLHMAVETKRGYLI